MENMSESLLCALIGVFGTVIGTIIGALLPAIQNGIGRKSIHISNTEYHWGDGQRDAFGSHHSSWLNFTLSILNKKGKDLILEKMSCKLFAGKQMLHELKCFDADTCRRVGGGPSYDELIYVDIPGHSSKIINVHLSSSQDLTTCDKVIFYFSWGFWSRKLVVWEKE